MSNACVVLVCGLPGSGKSFLSSKLLEVGSKEADSESHTPWVRLDFDDICEPVNKTCSDDGWNWEWKEQRKQALAIVENHISSKRIVLVDDTFHLRSMRRELFQLAREGEVGFGIIYVDTDVTICIQRDASRDAPIGEQLINKMHQRFETPREPWEIDHFLIIDNSSHNSDLLFGEQVSSCMEFVHTCCKTPLSSYAKIEEQKRLDQQRTAEDEQHQAELALRLKIKSIIQEMTTKDEKQRVARLLGTLKKTLINKIKTNNMRLDEALQLLENYEI